MFNINVLSFLTLLFAGLLAGFEIAVHYGFGSPPPSLPVSAQIRLRQAMILRLRILAPMLFLPTLVFGMLFTVYERHSEGVWLRWVAVGLLSVWIPIRAFKTVPVNSATLEWSPEAPPTAWREQVERTERFHVVAAWAAVLAFICFLVSAFQCP